MNNLTELAKKELSKDNGFIKANNYKVVKVDNYYCEIEGEITDSSMNPYGIIHGGYLFGLADTAAGIAAITDGRKALTINSSISYLKAATGKKIKAIAKSLKIGRGTSCFEVSIYDKKELVAVVNITYYYINMENNNEQK